jgi:hypothetical protein
MREAHERAANVVLYRTVCVAMHVDQNWDGAFGFAAGATAAPALCRLRFQIAAGPDTGIVRQRLRLPPFYDCHQRDLFPWKTDGAVSVQMD